MKENEFLDGMSNIESDVVECFLTMDNRLQIETDKPKINRAWLKLTAAAACFALIISVIIGIPMLRKESSKIPRWDTAQYSAKDISEFFGSTDSAATNAYTEICVPDSKYLYINDLTEKDYLEVYQCGNKKAELSADELQTFGDSFLPKLAKALKVYNPKLNVQEQVVASQTTLKVSAEKNDEITMPPSPVKSINLGLYVARLIHTNLAVANASAWQWWTAVSLNEDVPIQLLPIEGESGESVKYDGRVAPTKMFWATANYSFFVRPGMRRIDVRALNNDMTPLEAATSLMLSSYTDDSQVVTVIVNYADTDKTLSLACDNARKGKLYVTSIDKDLQYIGKHSLKALSIPARSIVTVVIDKK